MLIAHYSYVFEWCVVGDITLSCPIPLFVHFASISDIYTFCSLIRMLFAQQVALLPVDNMHRPNAGIFWIVYILVVAALCEDDSLEHARVGGDVMMTCPPCHGAAICSRSAKEYQDNQQPLAFSWRTRTRVFMASKYPPSEYFHVEEGYRGRAWLGIDGSLILTRVRKSDEGWYQCTGRLLVHGSEGPEPNDISGPWIYLEVNGLLYSKDQALSENVKSDRETLKLKDLSSSGKRPETTSGEENDIGNDYESSRSMTSSAESKIEELPVAPEIVAIPSTTFSVTEKMATLSNEISKAENTEGEPSENTSAENDENGTTGSPINSKMGNTETQTTENTTTESTKFETENSTGTESKEISTIENTRAVSIETTLTVNSENTPMDKVTTEYPEITVKENIENPTTDNVEPESLETADTRNNETLTTHVTAESQETVATENTENTTTNTVTPESTESDSTRNNETPTTHITNELPKTVPTENTESTTTNTITPELPRTTTTGTSESQSTVNSEKTSTEKSTTEITVTPSTNIFTTDITSTGTIVTVTTESTTTGQTETSTAGNPVTESEETSTTEMSTSPETLKTDPSTFSSTILHSSETQISEAVTSSVEITTTALPPNSRTLKYAFAITFLTIAIISMALLIVYFIKMKKRTHEYDELRLLP